MFIPIIGSEYPDKVIPFIDNAKKNVDIVVYDWRWYPERIGHPMQLFNMALVRAVKRGVQIRAIVNTASFVPFLKSVGINACTPRAKRTLHSKLLMIDNSILVIGSHNFTSNAFTSNFETSLIIDIPVHVTRFAEFFNNLYVL